LKQLDPFVATLDITTQEYLELLRKDKDNRMNDDFKKMIPYIRKLDVLKEANISDQEVLKIATCMELKRYLPNEQIFERGDVGNFFYIIFAGQVDRFM
jgi:CRP-like cAMP-binding protein